MEYFDLVKKAITDKGFSPLFEDLNEMEMNSGGWSLVDGVLKSEGNGDIWTKEEYGDFILDLEFQTAADTNSGVFLRCDDVDDWLNRAIELQILQPHYEKDSHQHGSIFDIKKPLKMDVVKEPGEWNHYSIICKGQHIYAHCNGHSVQSIDLSRWTEAGKNPDGTPNKFQYAYAEMAPFGKIGFQYHGNPIAFRNIKIKQL